MLACSPGLRCWFGRPASRLFEASKLPAVASLLLGCVITVTSASGLSNLQPGEDRPGGAATHDRKLDSNAFSHHSANLDFEQELNFKVGNGFFRRLWVSSPASTEAADGLGPLFNSRGCQRCHIKDGRGHPPLGNETHSESMLIRLSIPPQTDEDRARLSSGKLLAVPDPVYGSQLQSQSIANVPGEGNVSIQYQDLLVTLGDGTVVTLTKPVYTLQNLAYGEPHAELRLSPRIAPQMIGLGLLEAVAEESILANADAKDADNDGISGRPNMVWSREYKRLAVGRFGLKAGVASIDEQNQNAFNADIGLSTPLNPNATGDCTPAQQACLAAPDGNSPQYENLEVHSVINDLLLFYTRNLAVPARRQADDVDVLEGKAVFFQLGCAGCHNPHFETANLPERPEHSQQHIWPYTDLLLHDMGERLADHSPEGQASGREWRTAPLWGIGLTEVVNGHTRFLHDGRAQNLEQAVLWHGGEAEASRDAYMSLSADDRARILKFLESL